MLTQKAAERLQPGNKRIEKADGLVPGLYLVVQPSGAKSWAVRYRLRGKTVKLTLGRFPAIDLKEARQRGREALLAVGRGSDPHKEKMTAKLEPVDRDLFPAVLDRFLAAPGKKGKERRERTVNEWRRLIDKDVTPRWRKKHITEITKRDVIGVLDDIEARGAGLTVNRVYSAVLALFNFAARKNIIATSPMTGLDKPMAEESRDRVLTDAELKTLWLALDQVPYPVGPFAKLLLLTGARRSDVAGLTWGEIDKDARTWLLPAERSKNKQERLIPLSDEAVAVIDSITPIKSDAGYLFTTTGRTPISGFNSAKRAIDKATKGAIDDWTFHDFRRTASTTMHRLGFAPHICEAVLGHRVATGVAAVYNRYEYANEKRTALDTWARFLIDNAEGRKLSNVVDIAERRA